MANHTTKEILKKMLVENTGIALCDSGGTPSYDENGKYLGSTNGYGRGFERNRGRDFENELPTELEFKKYNKHLEINVTHNIYHFLEERCEISKLDEIFHGQYLKEKDPDNDRSWMSLMEEFPQWLCETFQEPCEECDGSENEDEPCEFCSGTGKVGSTYGEPGGIYGEGKPIFNYTYNTDNLLSQNIQYLYFTLGGRHDREEFAIIQIHNGCDARGGMTTPHVFEVGHSGSEYDILEDNRATIYCSGKNHHPSVKVIPEEQENLPGIDVDHSCRGKYGQNRFWDMEGYNSFPEGEDHKATHLEDYEVKVLDSKEDPNADNPEPHVWEAGKLCIEHETGLGYCPYCGARLEAGR